MGVQRLQRVLLTLIRPLSKYTKSCLVLRESGFEFLSQLLDILQGVLSHTRLQQLILSTALFCLGRLTHLKAIKMQSPTWQCGKEHLSPGRCPSARHLTVPSSVLCINTLG